MLEFLSAVKQLSQETGQCASSLFLSTDLFCEKQILTFRVFSKVLDSCWGSSPKSHRS